MHPEQQASRHPAWQCSRPALRAQRDPPTHGELQFDPSIPRRNQDAPKAEYKGPHLQCDRTFPYRVDIGCLCPGRGGCKTNLDFNGGCFERSLSLPEAAWERLQVVSAQQCANPAPCLLNASSGAGSRRRHHKHRQAFVAALRRAKQTKNWAPAAAENTHLGIRDGWELWHWISPAPSRW